MPTNSAIPLSVRPVQIDNPAEKILTLRNLAQQQESQQQEHAMRAQQMELNKLKLASEQREAAGVDALSSALKQSNGDYAVAADLLLKGGFAAESAALQKAASESVNSRLTMRKNIEAAQASAKEHLGELALNAKRDLKSGGSARGTIMAHLAVAATDGLVDEQQARSMLARLSAVPTEGLDQFLDQYLTPTIREREQKLRKETLEANNLETYGSTTPPSLQSESEWQINGKSVPILFNPKSGVRSLTPNGPDVSARLRKTPPASTIVNPQAMSDVKESVTGMREGTIPPMLPGRASKEYLATLAEAHRQGYDLQAAVTDWNATQKHISSINSTQQTRLNQSINALPELLDTVDALAAKWQGGRFPILNSANLALAKGGAYGDDVATVARQLDSQIADVTADLGSVYMGGNSPTDHALELAGKSLKGEWSAKVLKDMVALARKNVTIRRNSINTTGVAGASPDNPYAPKTADEPKVERWTRDKDGKLVKQ